MKKILSCLILGTTINFSFITFNSLAQTINPWQYDGVSARAVNGSMGTWILTGSIPLTFSVYDIKKGGGLQKLDPGLGISIMYGNIDITKKDFQPMFTGGVFFNNQDNFTINPFIGYGSFAISYGISPSSGGSTIGVSFMANTLHLSEGAYLKIWPF